jgi:hypothetical protein
MKTFTIVLLVATCAIAMSLALPQKADAKAADTKGKGPEVKM